MDEQLPDRPPYHPPAPYQQPYQQSTPYQHQHPQPYQHAQPPVVQVAPKNPGIALLASFFFPGLGSLMNGEAGKGVAIFAGYVISWMLVIVLIGIVGVFGFWIWGMVDAYQGAKNWNARHGIVS